MHRFWDDLIEPIFKEFGVKNIVEIGSKGGDNTCKMIKYCSKRNGFLHCIDPSPEYDYKELENKYLNLFKQHVELSLHVLGNLKNIDAVLVDGDHNWYTVFNELKLIDSYDNFPIVIFHDISWPYARRDLYYNPDVIPEKYKHSYSKKGIIQNKSELDEYGINSHLNNAINESSEKNGVLTAIEDFLSSTKRELIFYNFDILNGFGILFTKDYDNRFKNTDMVLKSYSKLLKLSEKERIKYHTNLNSQKLKFNDLASTYHKIKDNLVKSNEKCRKTRIESKKLKKINKKLKDNVNKHNDEIIKIKKDLSDNKKIISEKDELIKKYDTSFSWKITKPIRYLGKKIRNILYNPYIYLILKSKIRIGPLYRNLKAYNLIKKSNLFDENFYRNKYLSNSPINPILHYIYHGYKCNNPNKFFNSKYYLNTYKNVKKSKINPLVHYTLHGKMEGKEINWNYFLNSRKFSSKQINNIISFNEKISIVIPIYNVFEDTKKCINSVLKNTNIPFELILIDDCSTDNRISELLNSYEYNENYKNIKIIRNESNQGFVKNVNIGIKTAKNDVVLLNNDTIVTPNWLNKLKIAAYSDKDIGTVTPVSNAADAFSVPKKGKVNKIPDDLSLNRMANIVEKVSNHVYMEVPTGNGFCLYIKRELIEEIGIFDDEAFGKGYGEENDFCMRALNNGWKNIIDDTTYIFHKGSASFSDKKQELLNEHRKIIDKKYPDYKKRINHFLNSKELSQICDNVEKGLKNYKTENFDKKRILYVLHQARGGTPNTNIDLMNHVQNEYDCWILISDGKNLFLEHFISGNSVLVAKWENKKTITAENFYLHEFRNIYFNVVANLNIDIIHIRHLIKHTFDLPKIAKNLNIPVLLSFHDFYFICPSYNLLDDKNEYCRGICSESGNGKCQKPMKNIVKINDLKKFNKKWKNESLKLFSNVNYFITTSEIVKKTFLNAFPTMNTDSFVVIEHGRDFTYTEDEFFEVPSKNKKIKILFIGNVNNQKGANLIEDIKELDHDERLEFHFLGSVSNKLKNLGIWHGLYERKDLNDKIKKIKPSFIGIFSIWSETYCHTLSEAWSVHIPVLSTKIGVIEDRMRKNNGGWFIDHKDPQKAYDEILKISSKSEEYLKIQNGLRNISFPSTKKMTTDYLKSYNNLLND